MWRKGADHQIGVRSKIETDFGGCHGDGRDDLGGIQLAKSTNGVTHGCAGGKAVPNHNHRSAGDGFGHPGFAITELPTLQFGLFASDGVFDLAGYVGGSR